MYIFLICHVDIFYCSLIWYFLFLTTIFAVMCSMKLVKHTFCTKWNVWHKIYIRDSFYYLPKLHFGKYVTQSVCLYVCLFVCLWRCPTISQEQIVRSSPNLVHIWNLELRRDLLFLVLMTSRMTSSGLKVGQILKSPYLRQFLSYSVETKTEMQRWLWDIILLWLTSGVTSGASGSTLNFDIKMAAIFKIHVAY